MPDFQRSWVWSDGQIRSLLASISLAYPIGALMTLQTGNPRVRFRARPLEGIELSAAREPSRLLLDGQQRLTSLYLALKSPKPVPIRDARGTRMRRHYYADLNHPETGSAREQDGIFSVPDDRIVRTDFHRKVVLDLSTREGEIAAEKFPLDQVLNGNETMNWMFAYLESGPGARQTRFEKWKTFQESVLNPFTQYQVPVIALSRSNSRVAVCQVFEKVNTGGVVLTVFELLTATYAADGHDLRKDWESRRRRSFDHPLLSKIEEPAFLQLVTLLATYDRRREHVESEPDADRPPAVSCHRADMLKLSLDAYRAWADRAVEGLRRAARFLHGESILRWRDLPYTTQLVPLAAVFAVLGDEPLSRERRAQLRQWYWCGVLGEMYGGTTPTRFANDLQELVPWLADQGPAPRTVQDAQFQADRLLTLRTRNSAAYKGIYILLLRRARDPASGKRLDPGTFAMAGFDVSWIFPATWCARPDPRGKRSRGLRRPIEKGHWNCIVNKTPVRQQTMPFFHQHAPSRNLARLEERSGTSRHAVNEFLRTHEIAPGTLRQDDFATFFNRRFEALLTRIEKAMGKPVNRVESRDESPFFEAADDPAAVAVLVRRDIEHGESQWLELKSTAIRNLHTGRKDPRMEDAVLKTICGFMNAEGGTLVVGVADDGSAVGIEQDYPFVQGKDRDGWEKRLTDLVAHRMGEAAAAAMTVRFCELGGTAVAHIRVEAAPQPVFVKLPGNREGVLFARLNNTTHQLEGNSLLEFRQQRWPA